MFDKQQNRSWPKTRTHYFKQMLFTNVALLLCSNAKRLLGTWAKDNNNHSLMLAWCFFNRLTDQTDQWQLLVLGVTNKVLTNDCKGMLSRYCEDAVEQKRPESVFGRSGWATWSRQTNFGVKRSLPREPWH